jgi:hypothetical protein
LLAQPLDRIDAGRCGHRFSPGEITLAGVSLRKTRWPCSSTSWPNLVHHVRGHYSRLAGIRGTTGLSV